MVVYMRRIRALLTWLCMANTNPQLQIHHAFAGCLQDLLSTMPMQTEQTSCHDELDAQHVAHGMTQVIVRSRARLLSHGRGCLIVAQTCTS